MRRIDLQEYHQSDPCVLTLGQRDVLREVPSLAVVRADVEDGQTAYYLTPGPTVGAVDFDDLSVLIRPKIGISKLLSMACYAVGAYESRERRTFDFREDQSPVDTLALALSAAAHRAFSHGLLHGYVTREEALHSLRARIRFGEQIKRRFGVPTPLEVRYDEFTDDVLANRLVKAATTRLGGMRLRSQAARTGLAWITGMLENVSLVEFPNRNVPKVQFSRLNEHYRGVVELSRLALRCGSFEAHRGRVRAKGFLMNMNVVFEEFVTSALRDALGVPAGAFGKQDVPSLDEDHKINLKPDMIWHDGSSYVFVGDAKYKRLASERFPNADLYQILAYATALSLPGGMLVYAKGEAESVMYKVRQCGKRLVVCSLDLSGPLDGILQRIDGLARDVRALREMAATSH